MRRKRRRPEQYKEGRQSMSNSLLDDLITPNHLATRAWDVGEEVGGECHGRSTNSLNRHVKHPDFSKETNEELPSTQKQNPAK